MGEKGSYYSVDKPRRESEVKKQNKAPEKEPGVIQNIRNCIEEIMGGANRAKKTQIADKGIFIKKHNPSLAIMARMRASGMKAAIEYDKAGKKTLNGQWEVGKKDPSLTDNPTHEQLIKAGYKQYSVAIPSFMPGGGKNHGVIQMSISEAGDNRQVMEEIAGKSLFVFRSIEKIGGTSRENVFVKSA
jgi:hypothetical protein